MKLKRNFLHLAVASSIALLAACGGGGGGGNGSGTVNNGDNGNNGNNGTTTQGLQLAGVVSKGIITKGIVTAYELDSSGGRTKVGSTITNAKGEYLLDLDANYNGGVVEIEITAGADTKMTCDVAAGCGASIGFGQPVSLQQSFSLKAVIQPTGNKVVNIPVTPLTHMAAALALKSGNITKESVAAANTKVSNLVGFNIITTPVANINDTADINAKGKAGTAYGLYNAGVGAALFADGKSIETGLNDLATSFEDGVFSADDTVTITTILKAVETNTNEVKTNADASAGSVLAEAVTDINTQVAQTNGKVVGGGIDTNTSTPATPVLNQTSAIAAAKALINDARTVIISVRALEEKGKKGTAFTPDFSVQTTAVSDVFNKDTIVASQLLGGVLDKVTADLNTRTDLSKELANPQTYITPITSTSGASLGDITTTFSTTNGFSMTMNGTLTGSTGNVVVTNLMLSTNLTKDQVIASGKVLTALTATSAKLMLSGEVKSGASGIKIAESKPVSLSIDLDQSTEFKDLNIPTTSQGKLLETHIKSVSLRGDMVISNTTNNASFTGHAGLDLVKLANAPVEGMPVSLSFAQLKGDFTSDNGNLSASATLRIDNATAFDTFGALDSQGDIWLNGLLSANAIDMTVVEAQTSTLKAADTSKEFVSWQANKSNSPWWSNPGDISLNSLNTSMSVWNNDISGDVAGWQSKLNDISSGIVLIDSFDSSKTFTIDATSLSFSNSYSINGGSTNSSISVNLTSAKTPGFMATNAASNFQKDIDADGIKEDISLWYQRSSTGSNEVSGSLSITKSGGVDTLLDKTALGIDATASVSNLSFDGVKTQLNYTLPIISGDYQTCKADPALFFNNKSVTLNSWESQSLDFVCDNKLTNWGSLSANVDVFDNALIDGLITAEITNRFGDRAIESTLQKRFEFNGGFSSTGAAVAIGGYFNALVQLASPETAGHFVKGQLVVTANLQLPELPKVLATVSVDRTSFKGGNATIIVTYNGKTFNLDLASADVDAVNGSATLTISRPSGVKFVMTLPNDGTAMTGNVFYNNNGTDIDIDIGDITIIKSGVAKDLIKVTYVDGTTESIQ